MNKKLYLTPLRLNILQRSSYMGTDSKSQRTLDQIRQDTFQSNGMQNSTLDTVPKKKFRFVNLKNKQKQESSRLQIDTVGQKIFRNIQYQQFNQFYTIIDLCRAFLDYFSEIAVYKTEKYVLKFLKQQAEYNQKVMEILELYRYKFQTINAEQMLKILIHNTMDGIQDPKKYKIDMQFMYALEEMVKKLEEVAVAMEQDRMKSMFNNMVTHIEMIKEKQQKITHQLKTLPTQQQSFYLRTLNLTKRDTNFRVLTSDCTQRLDYEEEKVGRFELIQNKIRKKHDALESTVQNLKKYTLQSKE